MNTRPRFPRLKFLLLLAMTLSSGDARAAAAPPATPDPVEGKWIGTVGFPQDRVQIGLDLQRDEKGDLKAYLYLPVSNFYGLDLGTVVRDRNRYLQRDNVISLTLAEDRLEGTFYPLNAPVALRRTDELPREVPIPELPKGPGPRWQTKLGGAIYAPAAVRDGVAYVGTGGGTLNAVNVRDGSFVWLFAAGNGIFGQPLATDQHLFFVCDNGYLFKLDRKSGKEIWRYDLGGERASRILEHQVLDKLGIGEFDFDESAPQPVLADGVVYVGSGDGSFHAVDAASGRRIWRFAAGVTVAPVPWNSHGEAKVRTTAALDGSRVVFGSFDHNVYSLERSTGKEVWRKDTHAEVTGAPVLVGGRLIVGNRGGLLVALEPATGAVVWRALLWGSSVESTATPAADGLFYVGSSDMRRVSLIDSKDGRVVWRADVFGRAWARPALTAQRVYASAEGASPYQMRHLGSLTALDRESGKIVWRWPMPEWPGSLVNGFVAAPVVDGDTVVVGGLDGTLYGFPAE